MPTIDLDDIVPKVSRSAALRFSPLLVINGLSRKASFYWKLPQQPIKLSVLKLDGSCFRNFAVCFWFFFLIFFFFHGVFGCWENLGRKWCWKRVGVGKVCVCVRARVNMLFEILFGITSFWKLWTILHFHFGLMFNVVCVWLKRNNENLAELSEIVLLG